MRQKYTGAKYNGATLAEQLQSQVQALTPLEAKHFRAVLLERLPVFIEQAAVQAKKLAQEPERQNETRDVT